MLKIALGAEGVGFEEVEPKVGRVFLTSFAYQYSVEVLSWWRKSYGNDVRWLVGPGDKASASNWHNWKTEGCEVIEFVSTYPYHSSDVRSGGVSPHPAIRQFIIDHKLYDSN